MNSNSENKIPLCWPSRERDRLRPAEPTRPRKNDERLPPLPNNEPWLKEWKDMSEAQRKSMKELHFGPNNKHYRRVHIGMLCWAMIPPPDDKSDQWSRIRTEHSKISILLTIIGESDPAAPPVKWLKFLRGCRATDSTEDD